MPESEFLVPLPLEEFCLRLKKAFSEQEEIIRRKLPTDHRGEFVDPSRFWIQAIDPRKPNQWNDALKAAPKVECSIDSAAEGKTRVIIRLRVKAWIPVAFIFCLVVFGLCAALILFAAGVFGERGYVYGMRRAVGFGGAIGACAFLSMLGLVLWGRGNPSEVLLGILRAAGLFGSGRGRFG